MGCRSLAIFIMTITLTTENVTGKCNHYPAITLFSVCLVWDMCRSTVLPAAEWEPIADRELFMVDMESSVWAERIDVNQSLSLPSSCTAAEPHLRRVFPLSPQRPVTFNGLLAEWAAVALSKRKARKERLIDN